MKLFNEKGEEFTINELLDKGYVKVGSKSWCEYWKKGSEILELKNLNDKAECDKSWDNGFDADYNAGYREALNCIKRNLNHFKKDVHKIEMIYEGCDIDVYDGESKCERLLKEEIVGYYYD